MILKRLSDVCFVLAIGFVGLAAFQATASWRKPSVERLRFDVVLPDDLVAGTDHEVVLKIRNDNRQTIAIVGQAPC